MIEGLDLNLAEAETHIEAQLKEKYAILPKGQLPRMVRECLRVDCAFMERTGVPQGKPYDDDRAYDALLKGLTDAFPEHKMYCMRFVEDYMDALEAFLEQSGALEWE